MNLVLQEVMFFPAVFLVVSGITGSSWSFAQSPADPPGTSARCLREQISIEAPVPCPLGTNCCPCGFSALPARRFVLLRLNCEAGPAFHVWLSGGVAQQAQGEVAFQLVLMPPARSLSCIAPTEDAEAISHVPGTLCLPRTASAGRALFSHPRMLQSQGPQAMKPPGMTYSSSRGKPSGLSWLGVPATLASTPLRTIFRHPVPPF